MDIAEAVALVEADPNYRILRRIQMGAGQTAEQMAQDSTTLRRGLFVDTETTGLDHAKDKVVEIAAVPFAYDGAGAIWSVGEPFHSYNDPGVPIPPEMTKIHGITDEMVAGRSVDRDALAEFAKDATLVISHHAAFDRPFCEGIWSGFAAMPWACSVTHIPWAEEGIEGRKLTYIAASLGWFFDAHNSGNDCRAALFLLSLRLPSGRTGLSHVLERGLLDSRRVWCVDSPFETKDVLKARGYKWNDGTDRRYKAWHKEITLADLDAERRFLSQDIYRSGDRPTGARTTAITPLTRFTVRG